MQTVSVHLPDDLSTRLHNLVQIAGHSADFYILEAIQDYLDDLEDRHLAEHRLEEIHAGRVKPIPLEEVMKRHGLESLS
ncbi:MAG: CopG family transcriptional regulator [Magnetococcales bacterium]|nr:CopG family transcriptional regulator [Magnetococcales bacterium]